MTETAGHIEKKLHHEEITPKFISGMNMLILNIILIIAGLVAFIRGAMILANGAAFALRLSLLSPERYILLSLVDPLRRLKGLKTQRSPGFDPLCSITALKGEGFFFVNPLSPLSIQLLNPSSEPWERKKQTCQVNLLCKQ